MAECMQLYKNAAFMLSVSLDNKFEKSTITTTTMDPTTLVTFLFKAPAEARTIELFGSWDNFSRSYRMQNDRRRGSRYWTGCFKFSDIIFDGDGLSRSKPRTGGLLQGGTYWYFYRINDDFEMHDTAQAYTTFCPLLPGQTMNVMDVPIEYVAPPLRCCSASVDATESLPSLSSTHTLDPDAKFNPIEPPPVSKVHIRCVSDLALNGRLESQPHVTQQGDAASKAEAMSEDDAVEAVESKHTGRYYSKAYFADDGSSLNSRGSWRSAASSFVNSSVIDAYGIDTTDEPALYSFLDTPEADSGPTSSNDDAQINEVNTDIECDGLEYYDHLPNWDDDVDLCLHLQSNASASHLDSIEEEQEDLFRFPSPPRHDYDQEYVRPSTSYSFQDWRPRLFSPVSGEQQFDATASEAADEIMEIGDDWPVHQQATSYASDMDHDIYSPTFTATTISSGGVNTPFRLSQGCTRSTSGHGSTDDSIQDVADRLRSLGSDDHELDLPSPIIEGEESTFTPFPLAHTDEAHSVHSLGKLSSGKASIAHSVPSADLMPDLRQDSFSDAIFSELTYLGGSIS